MKAAILIVLLVLAAGCISSAPAKPSDEKMDDLFSKALDDAKTTVEPITTTTSTATTYTVKTTTTVRISTTQTTGTQPKTPQEGGIECSQIVNPGGPSQCAKGYCPATGQACRYLPGSFASGETKCVCARPK